REKQSIWPWPVLYCIISGGWVSLPEYKLKFKSRLPDILAPSVGVDILPGLNARKSLASALITVRGSHFDARWLVVLEDGEYFSQLHALTRSVQPPRYSVRR